MDNNNKKKDLLRRAYNCKSDEFETILEKIDNELAKDKNDQDALTAKLVLTSKMAVKRIDSN